MATKKQDLKPNKRTGLYSRDIGWKWSERVRKYIQQKFYLGQDERAAKIANLRLEHLWECVEAKWAEDDSHGMATTSRPEWNSATLAMGMAIAKGKTNVILPGNPDLVGTPALQVRYFSLMQAAFPLIKLIPEDQAEHAIGVEQELRDAAHHQRLGKVIAQRILDPLASGGMLHAAFDDYADFIREQKSEVNAAGERQLTRWGNTQIRTVERFKQRHADIPLSTINYDQCESMILYWRNRPPHKRTGKPLAAKTAASHVWQLNDFFRWLHKTDKYEWRKPDDLNEISATVKLRPDEKAARLTPQQVETYSRDELVLLYQYATPIERCLLLLGLNCGFGIAEIGSLRVNEVHLLKPHPHAAKLGFSTSDQDSFIQRIRLKTGVYGEWRLWSATVKAMQWALRRRKVQSVSEDGTAIPMVADSFLLLTEGGYPYTKPTVGENSSGKIPSRWEALTKRIQVDHPAFRKLSFNKLRKTTGNMIRDKSDGEIMAVFHARGRAVSTDDLADQYSNRPFRKVFDAIELVGLSLETMFAACDNPFPEEVKRGGANISRGTIEKIKRLKELGISVERIAQLCNVHRSTIHRRTTEGKS